MVSVSAKKVKKKISCLCTFKGIKFLTLGGSKVDNAGGWGEESLNVWFNNEKWTKPVDSQHGRVELLQTDKLKY
jgi:hypothetical protein